MERYGCSTYVPRHLISIYTSPPFTQPSLVATTNKDTLLKLSHMMGLDSHSHGPKSFHGFYTDRAARQVDMSVQRSPDNMGDM